MSKLYLRPGNRINLLIHEVKTGLWTKHNMTIDILSAYLLVLNSNMITVIYYQPHNLHTYTFLWLKNKSLSKIEYGLNGGVS